MKPLTTAQVARLFYLTAQTVINWTKRGKIKCQRLGSSPRKYLISDVREFMNNNKLDSKYLNVEALKAYGLLNDNSTGKLTKEEVNRVLLRQGLL